MAETTMSKTLPRRDAVPVEHTWNAESVFPSRAAFQEELSAVLKLIGEADKFRGRLAEGPGVLADWLAVLEQIVSRARKLYTYATMSRSSNVEDQEAASLADQAGGMFGRAIAAMAFTEPELIAIGREKLAQWMKQEPRLAIYEHYADDLFRRHEHVRTADVEQVLGMLAEPSNSIFGLRETLVNADLSFEPAADSAGEAHPVAPSAIDGLLINPDRTLRENAWNSYADGFLKMKNTLATMFSAAIKLGNVTMRARRYSSMLEASLFEDNIPVEVFHNLLDTYQKNLPTWRRYWRVRRKALGVETLHPYDIWAPLSSKQFDVGYEQAVDWIMEGLAPLGDAYVSTARRGLLQDRWVDRYPNQGKGQAEFSSGAPGTFPFIMMNYANNVESLSTLTHELGHSMHSYLTWQSQPVMYSMYSIFVAEVASNFNQAMVRAYLLDSTGDREFQIAILEEAMRNFHRYFFLMPTLARFEHEVHQRIEQGQAVPADALTTLMADLFEEAYGGEMHVDRTRVGITWAQFIHMYMPYYVFQYATGISAANALAKRIREGKPGAVESYLNMLRAGGSLYPMDALRMAGVDMASPDPVNEAFEVLAGYVDRLEELTT